MPPLPSLEQMIAPSGASPGEFSARVPVWRAMMAQFGGVLLTLAILSVCPFVTTGRVDTMMWALLQGCFAALLGRALGMESWWVPIHFLFVPALSGMLGMGLPPFYFLGAFCLLASVYWGVSGSRVPLFLSNRAAASAVVDMLPTGKGFTFIDLGSGLGGLLGFLSRERPAGCYCGIESAPLPFCFSWVRARLTRQPCAVSWGRFQDIDLGDYDVVYAYLSPAAMTGLWKKASHEMRAGSLLISNSFPIPGITPTATVATGAQPGARVFLWRM